MTTTSSYKSPYASPRPKSIRPGDRNIFGVQLDQSITKAQSKNLYKFSIYSPTHYINGAIRGTPRDIYGTRKMYSPIAEEIYLYLKSEAILRFHTPEVIEKFKASEQWAYIKNEARAAGAVSQTLRASKGSTVLSPRDMVAIFGDEIEFVNIDGFSVYLDDTAIMVRMRAWREEINYEASLTLFELSLWWNTVKPTEFYVEARMNIVGEIANIYGIPRNARDALFLPVRSTTKDSYVGDHSRHFRFATVKRESLFWLFVLYANDDPPESIELGYRAEHLKSVQRKLGARAVASILHRTLNPEQLSVLADAEMEDLDSAAALVKLGFTDGATLRKAIDEGVDGSLLTDFFSSQQPD